MEDAAACTEAAIARMETEIAHKETSTTHTEPETANIEAETALMALKNWLSRNLPSHFQMSTLPCCVELAMFVALCHKIAIEVDRKH